jgi:hypothetical protein
MYRYIASDPLLESTNLKYAATILPVSDRIHCICIEPMKQIPVPFRMRECDCLSYVKKVLVFVTLRSDVSGNHPCFQWDLKVIEDLFNMRRVRRCRKVIFDDDPAGARAKIRKTVN